MTVAADHAAPAGRVAVPPRARWQVWAFAGICVAAGVLYAWRIGAGQLGNTYYSAAVKSMTGSFTNFLFGSFDPYGVFTVDKPPMSLWPQALSVLVFGFHGWALLLPQVLEGVAAVFLLHRAVRLWAGENVALLAALILTLTPITVAINRDNNPDTLLVLLLVAAAYAFTRSVKADTSRARTNWLLWCAFFIGCGFVTKMMQAWIVVPGFALAYLAGTSAPVKRRILDLLGAGVVLFASSFWWAALHDWWPGAKPYMGGSTDGTAWNLIFGYNGFGRIFGNEGNPGGSGGPRPDLPEGITLPSGMGGGAGGMFGGDTGLGRMFSTSVGGQISWLLPLALVVLVVVAVQGVLRMAAKQPGDAALRAGWFAWGGWLLVTAVVFSYAQGIWHPYYTTMLAPAIAAISAAGLARFWRAYRGDGAAERADVPPRAGAVQFLRALGEPGWLLLPAAVALTAVWAFVLASRDSSWQGWTRWAVLVAGVVALLAGRLAEARRVVLSRVSLVLGLVTLLLVPAVWSTATAATGENLGVMPAAGPSGGFGGMRPGGTGGPGGFPGTGDLPGGTGAGFPGVADLPQMPGGTERPSGGFGGMMGAMDGKLTDEQRRVLDYAKQHSGGAEITLAVDGSASTVAGFIIGSDETVIGMGGFMGSDDSPSVGQLQQWTAEGKLKFVLGGSGGGMPGMNGGAGQRRQQWTEQHCTAVDPAAYGGQATQQDEQTGPMGMAQTLYECHA